MKEKDKKESFIAINDIFDENSSEDNFDIQTVNNPFANPNIILIATKNP